MIDDELLMAVFPHLEDVAVEAVALRGTVLKIAARTRAIEAGCPDCGVVSGRVHGRYARRLSDAAAGGREVEIVLTVRRFTCAEAACRRRTFAEQVPSLAGRYQRRTGLLTGVLQAIAVMLAGRAGARLAGRLRVAVSRSSLLRLLRAAPEPPVGELTAIGIDDFALRRGHVYGTVVIDMDTHKPVDVLPDRTAATVETWLNAHPGIQVICRDRAGAYAEGARAGAPAAIQVADRWHLYKNLAEAVEKVVARYRPHLDEPVEPPAGEPGAGAELVAAEQFPGGPDAAGVPQEPVEGSSQDTPAGRMITRTLERYRAIHALLEAGRNRAQVSRELHLDPVTVRRYANTQDVAALINPRRTYATILDNHKAYLHRRWNEGVTDAAQLYREIKDRGYDGSCKSVRRFVQPLRAGLGTPDPKAPSPTIRDVTQWLTRRPEDVSRQDTATLAAIVGRVPALAGTQALVGDFGQMLTGLTGKNLPAWLDRVERDGEPELRTFAKGLRRDQAAVTAGLTLPYSSGPVEGNVNRIKMIKRQMYGRAGFDLLRHRILLRA